MLAGFSHCDGIAMNLKKVLFFEKKEIRQGSLNLEKIINDARHCKHSYHASLMGARAADCHPSVIFPSHPVGHLAIMPVHARGWFKQIGSVCLVHILSLSYGSVCLCHIQYMLRFKLKDSIFNVECCVALPRIDLLQVLY